VYGSSDADLRSFSRFGVPLGSIVRPGEAANDADLTFAPKALTLGTTQIAAGTALFVNGETGIAEIYAVDKTTGTVQATLATSFGASHVVGGSYHPGRDTFFLVQDRQVSGTANDSVVAEINPASGAVVNSFRITDLVSTFSVNFGDVEVSANGNLFVVSSDESSIAEITPGGVLVQQHALPAGVSSLSGIAFDQVRGEAWVSGTGGTIWQLGGVPMIPEPSSALLCAAGAILVFGYTCRRRKDTRRSG
jgi:hypothetical protein